MSVRLLEGDCLELLKTLEPDSLDSCVTDPPYHLTSIVKRFGGKNAAPAQHGADGAFARASRGFMGKQWDGGDIAFRPELWAEVLRVLKPGGHLLAFSGTRTYHRMACAIEDAGFEIRDQIGWAYGSGFPKSHDVSKGIDKARGVKGSFGEAKSAAHERYIDKGELRGDRGHEGWQRPWMDDPEAVANAGRKYMPGSTEASEWQGWGTALKPAWEPIVVARKPLIGTVAENVLRFGTGAINIDGCRIEANGRPLIESKSEVSQGVFGDGLNGSRAAGVTNLGRWPANLCHDGSDEVLAAFPTTKPTRPHEGDGKPLDTRDAGWGFKRMPSTLSDDGGSAARFFYCAKATAADRAGSKHPTVKPLKLMRWLVRLVTPPGGTVLDLFAGTGSTGKAAEEEGFSALLMEREKEYQADIRRRLGIIPTLEDMLA